MKHMQGEGDYLCAGAWACTTDAGCARCQVKSLGDPSRRETSKCSMVFERSRRQLLSARIAGWVCCVRSTHTATAWLSKRGWKAVHVCARPTCKLQCPSCYACYFACGEVRSCSPRGSPHPVVLAEVPCNGMYHIQRQLRKARPAPDYTLLLGCVCCQHL